MQKTGSKGSWTKNIKAYFDISDELSQRQLSKAINHIIKKLKINTRYDIPYLAGYSLDGKTIYIDKHVPRYMQYKKKRINVHRFLIMHEVIEKTLLLHFGNLNYALAHEIATRAEKAIVDGEHVSWNVYVRYVQKYLKQIQNAELYLIPANLDLKPYRDEKDKATLKKMKVLK